MKTITFANTAIVACGTMSLELQYLQNEGFLDKKYIYYTTPGLHQSVSDLKQQLVRQIRKARKHTYSAIVVYGGKYCYVNADPPDSSYSERY